MSPKGASELPRSWRCRVPTSRPAWRMRGLEAAGGLAWWGGDVPAADQLYQSQVDMARQLGDDQGLAEALFNLAHTRFVMDPDPEAVSRIRAEAEMLARKVGDEQLVTRVAWTEAFALMAQGNIAEAERIARDTLPKSEAAGDAYYIALATTALGGVAFAKGDLDGAVDMGMRGLLISHAMGDVASITLSLQAAAALLYVAGLPAEALTLAAAYGAHGRRYGVQPPLDVDSDWLGLGNVIRGHARGRAEAGIRGTRPPGSLHEHGRHPRVPRPGSDPAVQGAGRRGCGGGYPGVLRLPCRGSDLLRVSKGSQTALRSGVSSPSPPSSAVNGLVRTPGARFRRRTFVSR